MRWKENKASIARQVKRRDRTGGCLSNRSPVDRHLFAWFSVFLLDGKQNLSPSIKRRKFPFAIITDAFVLDDDRNLATLMLDRVGEKRIVNGSRRREDRKTAKEWGKKLPVWSASAGITKASTMNRPLSANSRNEAEMIVKAKRSHTMAQDPLGKIRSRWQFLKLKVYVCFRKFIQFLDLHLCFSLISEKLRCQLLSRGATGIIGFGK